ncbi:MAG: trmB [Gammaproteobacteria bacterium]|jgi:tRNA (guanine-N7-)-methyltransferase|nr:trmB [Gammaproteobacteria bacterium]MCE3237816.1 trmB [Gammaproteobacteria bacterium]
MHNNTSHRRIRSFVRRDSRITEAQQQALKTLWPQFGLNMADGFINFATVFQRKAPILLEIGFGSGHSLLAAAIAQPEKNFIGIETHKPGVGTLLLNIQANKTQNIRIYNNDAVEVLTHCIPLKSLHTLQLFFPDPWPKRRHHKRRLIQTEFVKLLLTKLEPNGELHLATDWQDYAIEMMKVLSHIPELTNLAGTGNFSERSTGRPIITKFEQQAQRASRQIYDLRFSLNQLL